MADLTLVTLDPTRSGDTSSSESGSEEDTDDCGSGNKENQNGELPSTENRKCKYHNKKIRKALSQVKTNKRPK